MFDEKVFCVRTSMILMQVLEGSHSAGRIEHSLTGGEIGANMDRVQELQNVCPLKYIEQEPG